MGQRQDLERRVLHPEMVMETQQHLVEEWGATFDEGGGKRQCALVEDDNTIQAEENDEGKKSKAERGRGQT